MSKALLSKIVDTPKVKFIFCDFYDTVVHRNVHPMQVFKIWAKLMIVEFGLPLGVPDLFAIRRASLSHLAQKSGLKESEVPYDRLIAEVHQRLISSCHLSRTLDSKRFIQAFRTADYRAETSVQYLNLEAVEALRELKARGYSIYCVSDFHLDEALIRRIMEHHGILDVYDDVFVSASRMASKENKGLLYQQLLQTLKVSPQEVFMIGDNKVVDVAHAQRHGIQAYFFKRTKHKALQKLRLFGNDEKEYKGVVKAARKMLKSKEHPYAEYLLLFHACVERLYAMAKKNNVQDLFFLAREGLFLKKLFDAYQEHIGIDGSTKIKTHYLKISRQGAMQISFKPLLEEDFKYLKGKYDDLSLRQFLKSFLITTKDMEALGKALQHDLDEVIPDFFETQVYLKLIQEPLFVALYEDNRQGQKMYFERYLKSFGADFGDTGMHLVDVGWGGTMQECLYQYMEERIPVTGYYLGLQEIYNITEHTKRFGLLFSVYPYIKDTDHILMANRQLYEQLLAAPHGSTLGYKETDGHCIEYHKKEEKSIFDEIIGPLQDYMFGRYGDLLQALFTVCYDDGMVTRSLVNLKIELDLVASRPKMRFVNAIARGFYQNIGNNKVGITYDMAELGSNKKMILKNLFLRPSQMFRYIVKVKPLLYRKKLYWLSWPVNGFAWHIKGMGYLKRRFLKQDISL
ncbi:HAD family hydrolase [Maribacter sp. 2307ULW6-5]|uniref:HAD family hydrolase n=1 Tax=Maribacter sp. 2307ULW6-5 TaxID=3386275 RepID=UPI0039BC948E